MGNPPPPFSSNGTTQGTEDLSLIGAFNKGDASAFEALVLKYQDRVHTLCRYMLNNPEDAGDATQETFLKAFRNLGYFTPDASFYTWLYRIAINTCLDHKRRSFLRRVVFPEGGSDLLESLPSRNPTPEKLYETKESLHAVQLALQGISPTLRAALVLKEMEELAYEEIADVLDISVGTVKSRISRAREELMKILRNKRKRETLKG